MRSEYTANELLAATPARRLRTHADTRTPRYPRQRTLWGFIFFWL